MNTVNDFSRKTIVQKPKNTTPAFSSKNISQPSHQKKAAFKSFLKGVVRTIPTNKAEFEKKKVPFFFLLLFTVLCGLMIFKVVFTSYQYLSAFDIKDLFGLISADLQTDDKKRTNILLLGVGGGEHDGADLTDSIMIASFHQDIHSASLVSIPRDLWLDLPGYGSSRINKIYDTLKGQYGSTQALDILRKGVENISNLDIPYVVKVDFQGFSRIIDTLGGIEVTVEKSIYDTEYPKEDQSGYETFSLEAGTQTLDGTTALKFARSRHSSSDFDRSSRQHLIIEAIKKKAQETNFLSSPLLVKNLYQEFSDHLETNLKTTELISLARMLQNIQQGDIASLVLINNEILDVGSFLYTPERELYGGAFVLLPIGNNYEKIQRFLNIAFEFPRFFTESSSIQILNGTRKSGFAAQIGQKLIPYGFNIQHYANADRRDYDVTHYVIHHPEKTQVTEAIVKQFFPEAIKIKPNEYPISDESYDLSIIIGLDMQNPIW